MLIHTSYIIDNDTITYVSSSVDFSSFPFLSGSCDKCNIVQLSRQQVYIVILKSIIYMCIYIYIYIEREIYVYMYIVKCYVR